MVLILCWKIKLEDAELRITIILLVAVPNRSNEFLLYRIRPMFSTRVIRSSRNGCLTLTWLFIFCVTGAIKFGDELSVEQCASVLRRLARCRLPFQCAHGRPSCVPLYNISSIFKAYSDNGVRVSSPKNDSLHFK